MGIDRKEKCNIYMENFFFYQLQQCFSGLSLVLKKRRLWLAYHQILPLVEVNQAIDAWSFRQGCNLPISHHSPKYKTETLIFNGDRKELFSTKKTVTYTRNFFLPKKCNIYKELFSTKKMFQWTFISPEEKEIVAGLSPDITSCRSESSY